MGTAAVQPRFGARSSNHPLLLPRLPRTVRRDGPLHEPARPPRGSEIRRWERATCPPTILPLRAAGGNGPESPTRFRLRLCEHGESMDTDVEVLRASSPAPPPPGGGTFPLQYIPDGTAYKHRDGGRAVMERVPASCSRHARGFRDFGERSWPRRDLGHRWPRVADPRGLRGY